MTEASTELEIRLVQAARQGDLGAWRELVTSHSPRLAAYIGARLRRPEIVDKLVADTIFAAWKHLSELERDADFAAWFRKMGGSVTMNWYKRHHGEGISGEFPLQRCPDIKQAQQLHAVDMALGKLPEKERMALEQRFRAGLDGSELAEVLHLSVTAAQDLVRHALRHAWGFYRAP